MIARETLKPARLPIALSLALSALGFSLSGCADMNENMTAAFADPAKYDLYDCKQLEAERKSLGEKIAELQGLISKAQTGTGPSWRSLPIATTTSRCAGSRIMSRKPGARGGVARRRHRRPPRRTIHLPLRRPRVPLTRSRPRRAARSTNA